MFNENERIEKLTSAVCDISKVRELDSKRLVWQLEFAQGLAKLEGKKNWTALVDKAFAVGFEAAKADNDAEFNRLLGEIENILEPIGKAGKKYTLHCVGHAHMDMNWMWSWPETVALTNDTIITICKLLDEFPEFRFSQDQASIYEIIREYNPDLFEKIKKYIAEGRWEITAAHWVEGDKNLADGESLARHMLYTRQFMKEHFGLEPEQMPLEWEPDTFGHAATIPSIVSRGGVKRYYMCRGGNFEKPPVFWWKGPDGNKILVNLEQSWYNDLLGPNNIRGLLGFCEKTGLKDWMCVYGIGDHGGGPTRRDIRLAQEMNKWPIFPVFKFNTTNEYYEILEKQGDKLPTLERELNYEFSGCYTSQFLIKKTNRMAEHACKRAEYAAATAWALCGREYPTDKFKKCWQDSLLGHFHDILPGSGVAATREYHSGLFQNTAASTHIVGTESMRTIASEIDTSFAGLESASSDNAALVTMSMGGGIGRGTVMGGMTDVGHAEGKGRAFVVFNPTAAERTEVIKCTVWDAEGDNVHTRNFVAHFADGSKTTAQRLEDGTYWSHHYTDLAVTVTVPPMGYSSFVIEDCGVTYTDLLGLYANNQAHPEGSVVNHAMKRPEYIGAAREKYALENEHIYVEFDPASAGIISLIDKKTKIDFASPENPAGILECNIEQPGPMSAWVIRPTRELVSPLEVTEFIPDHKGPHLGSFKAKMRYNESTIETVYSLGANDRMVNIQITAHWYERGHSERGTPSLRMAMPVDIDVTTSRYEIPFGSIERNERPGTEVPALRWVDVQGKKTVSGKNRQLGCALLNDSTYGFSLDGNVLRATLIRSSYMPDDVPEFGKHELSFSIVPHVGKLSNAELTGLGDGFNNPLQVLATDIHKGRLDAVSGAAVSSNCDNVIVTGIKKAESEDALIFRLLETEGKAADAQISLSKKLFGKVSHAVETDLLERELDKSNAKAVASGFTIKLGANAIGSVKVKL